MMTVRVSSLIFLYCRWYESMHVCVVVSFNICFARQSCVSQVDCLFVFSLSLSLTFDRPIICSFSQLFSLLQKADSRLIIYNAGF